MLPPPSAPPTSAFRNAAMHWALFAVFFAAPPDAERLAFFEKSVRPVFAKHCQSCHSHAAGKAKGGLVVDSRGALLAGGDSGPALVPGDTQKSLLIAAVKHADGVSAMPPKGKLNA